MIWNRQEPMVHRLHLALWPEFEEMKENGVVAFEFAATQSDQRAAIAISKKCDFEFRLGARRLDSSCSRSSCR